MKRVLGPVCAVALGLGAITAPQVHAEEADNNTAATDVAYYGSSFDPIDFTVSTALYAVGTAIAMYFGVTFYHMYVDSGVLKPIPSQQIPAFLH
ncbi:MAG: hypothetical protein Q3961_02830 [Bifidobacteriaceae bacterium]|nr:hypothetical protein [Bifidobacteriaceae bacterium]